MRYLLATCTFIGTLILSQADVQAISVRVDIEPGTRILAPRDAIKFVVRPSGGDAQADTDWTCKASLIDQASGTVVWSEEKELNGTKTIADGLLFHKKAPRQAGVYQLRIELQSQSSGPRKTVMTQQFPLIVAAKRKRVAAKGKSERSGIGSLLGGRSDSTANSAQLGSNGRSLAKWYSASELAAPLGLSGVANSDSIDWTQVYRQSEQFISDLQPAGFDAVALPLATKSTILFPMTGARGERLANAAEVDILELLLQRADQAGVKLYLTLPGKAVSAASPAVGGEALVSNAPVMVLETVSQAMSQAVSQKDTLLKGGATSAYITAYDSTRHQIPWVVSRAVRQIASRYTDHESLAAIVIDNRALPTTSLNSGNLSSLHAMPIVDATDANATDVSTDSGELSLNQRMAQQLALTDAKVFFVAGLSSSQTASSQTEGSALSWKTIGQSRETTLLKEQLAAARSEVEAMRLHRVENCLLNPSFESFPNPGARNQIPGWRIEPAAHAEASIDPTGSHAGKQCVLLQSRTASKTESPAVSIQSGPFELPSTRRLAVLTWMRVDPNLPTPDVHLVLEGKYNGEKFRHSVEANQVQAGLAQADLSQANYGHPALGDQWTPVTLQLDELPMGGISELTVRIELHSAGTVWVDDLQVSDMWLTDAEMAGLTKIIDSADDNLTAGRLPEAREIVQSQLSAKIAKYGTLQYLTPRLVGNSMDTDSVSSPQEPTASDPAMRLPVVASAAVSSIAVSEVIREPKAQRMELANAPVVLPTLSPLSETSILPIGSENIVGENIVLETAAPETQALADSEQPWWKFWGARPQGDQPEEVATSKWSRRVEGRNNSSRSRPQSGQEFSGEFSGPQAAVASIWGYLKPGDEKPGDDASASSTTAVPELKPIEAKSFSAVRVASAESQTPNESTRRFGFLPRLGGQPKTSNSVEIAPEDGKAFGLARLWSPKNKAETEPIIGSEPIGEQPDSFSLFGVLTGETDGEGESVEDVKAEAVHIAEIQTAKVEQTVTRIAQSIPGGQSIVPRSAEESSESDVKPVGRFVKPIVNFFRK